MVLYLCSEHQGFGPVVQWIECRFPEPKVPRSSRGGVTLKRLFQPYWPEFFAEKISEFLFAKRL